MKTSILKANNCLVKVAHWINFTTGFIEQVIMSVRPTNAHKMKERSCRSRNSQLQKPAVPPHGQAAALPALGSSAFSASCVEELVTPVCTVMLVMFVFMERLKHAVPLSCLALEW